MEMKNMENLLMHFFADDHLLYVDIVGCLSSLGNYGGGAHSTVSVTARPKCHHGYLLYYNY